MWRKFRKFIHLSAAEKKLFIEAYVTLGVMRAAILTFSFKRLIRSFQQFHKDQEIPSPTPEQMKLAIAVGKAISRASASTPWESACLVQSLTVHRMLKKRGIPGVFYLGASKDSEADGDIKAHAWSRCGDVILTGSKGHEAFTVLSVFGWDKKCQM